MHHGVKRMAQPKSVLILDFPLSAFGNLEVLSPYCSAVDSANHKIHAHRSRLQRDNQWYTGGSVR